MHNQTQKQGNKNKQKHSPLPLPFLCSGRGPCITPPLCSLPVTLPSFCAVCPIPQTRGPPDQSSPDSGVCRFSCFSGWYQSHHLRNAYKNIVCCWHEFLTLTFKKLLFNCSYIVKLAQSSLTLSKIHLRCYSHEINLFLNEQAFKTISFVSTECKKWHSQCSIPLFCLKYSGSTTYLIF